MLTQTSHCFDGLSAVITGGASGIGLAVAQRFRQSGARVSIWDRAEPTLAGKSSEVGTYSVQVDITRLDQVEHAYQQTVKQIDSIDILVNAAGIVGPHRPLWEYALSDWQTHLDVGLTGTFLCCRTCVPAMAQRGWGRIVNIASMAGKEGNAGSSAYSAAKAGVIALTKSLGKELATSGVLVNCVTPGATRTPLFAQSTPEYIEGLLAKIPMKRFAEPQELAALVTWLCSDECSFSTGAVFDFSGGRATY